MLADEVRRLIDETVAPLLGQFTEAIAEMRRHGARDDEIEAVVQTATKMLSRDLDETAGQYVLCKFRAAVERAALPSRLLN